MNGKVLPIKEVSINNLFFGSENCTYMIPVYQRNYAWGKDEVSVLIQDVYDSFHKNSDSVYFIGTLVSYDRGDSVFEIIDGQQRLTTIRLVLSVLDQKKCSRLTYRARKLSDETLQALPDLKIEEKDTGIENGFRFVKNAISEIVPEEQRKAFSDYFINNVHIIHYQVPKDIDLNHYFEVMNSRGEQLEKPEIVKAKLMQQLSCDQDRVLFNSIWNSCREMNIYIQQVFPNDMKRSVFSTTLNSFIPGSFDDLVKKASLSVGAIEYKSIQDLLKQTDMHPVDDENTHRQDGFLSIIDFPNFILIVLKITKMKESGFDPVSFNLDDKLLLEEFFDTKPDYEFVRKFAFNLLKARFLLDNYIVHHSREDDSLDSNPWNLQVWTKDNSEERPKNLLQDAVLQDKLVQLLSMFEVSFTAKQRKNYLFYVLFYLMENDTTDLQSYLAFVDELARRYFTSVYLVPSKLNTINTPMPGSFDEAVLNSNCLERSEIPEVSPCDFIAIYGDGSSKSKGIPLFIFNYMDFKIWELYANSIRGQDFKEGSTERKAFFDLLGCSDFGLKVFDRFYFSRTRRSLEHYYPQAAATGLDGALNENQINCFGNYGMIGSSTNSSGSNWSPITKLDHYLDSSGKINQISVASLKFMIMMQICKDRHGWSFVDIQQHQEKMISILMA